MIAKLLDPLRNLVAISPAEQSDVGNESFRVTEKAERHIITAASRNYKIFFMTTNALKDEAENHLKLNV